MNRKFNPQLICPLCGINRPRHNGRRYISREHVPPKSLFLERTNNLITIPSCDKCNNGTSRHDEDFKIGMGIYLGSNMPDIWKETRHSLDKDEPRRKKRNSILEKTSPVLTCSSTGRWGHKITIDRTPIDAVVKKIVRGLHWYISGIVLPSKIDLTIIMLAQDRTIHPESQNILDKFGQKIITGNGAFQAHYALVPNEPHASLWKLTLYQIDCFMIRIKPAVNAII